MSCDIVYQHRLIKASNGSAVGVVIFFNHPLSFSLICSSCKLEHYIPIFYNIRRQTNPTYLFH